MKFPAIVNSGFSNVLTVLVFLQFCCQFSSIYTAHRMQFKTFIFFADSCDGETIDEI